LLEIGGRELAKEESKVDDITEFGHVPDDDGLVFLDTRQPPAIS
jgi:hypothetical protein